jgi:hypothetical protein
MHTYPSGQPFGEQKVTEGSWEWTHCQVGLPQNASQVPLPQLPHGAPSSKHCAGISVVVVVVVVGRHDGTSPPSSHAHRRATQSCRSACRQRRSGRPERPSQRTLIAALQRLAVHRLAANASGTAASTSASTMIPNTSRTSGGRLRRCLHGTMVVDIPHSRRTPHYAATVGWVLPGQDPFTRRRPAKSL